MTSHVQSLLERRTGSTLLDVARASGVSEKTLRSLMSETNRRPSVYAPTARKLLAVTPADLQVTDRRLVDGTKARKMVESLLDQGYPLAQVAEEAGVSRSTLATSNMESVYMDTALRVQQAYAWMNGRRSSPALVSGLRTARMVESLMVLGWRRRDVYQASGVSPATMARANGLIYAENERAVAAAFETMKYRMGPSETTRRRARALGYAPWAAWESRKMGDPKAKPDPSWVDDPQWRQAIHNRYYLTTAPPAPSDDQAASGGTASEAERLVVG